MTKTIHQLAEFQPQIARVESGPEPSLWEILFLYYAPHMPHENAVRCTNEYLDALSKEQAT
jgi:hypothetical protein